MDAMDVDEAAEPDAVPLGGVERADAEPVVAASSTTSGISLEQSLRERLTNALQELAKCRDLLAEHEIPYESSFGCKLVDHADVLEVQSNEVKAAPEVVEMAASAAPEHVSVEEFQSLKEKHAQELDEVHASLRERDEQIATLRERASILEEQKRQADETAAAALSSQPVVDIPLVEDAVGAALSSAIDSQPEDALSGAGATDGVIASAPAGKAGAAASSSSSAGASAGVAAAATATASGEEPRERNDEHEREKEKLEVELSMAKALLMLNNVNMNMDLDEDRGSANSAAEVVSLKGNRQLIQLLLTMKQKSFRMAMQQQSQEHSSLQSRFERLSKVLN